MRLHHPQRIIRLRQFCFAALSLATMAPFAGAAADDRSAVIPPAQVAQRWAIRQIPPDLEIECGANGVRCTVRSFMQTARVCALLIARDERTLFEIYSPNSQLCSERVGDGGGAGNGHEHLYGVASVTKSISSTLLGFALQDGAGRVDLAPLQRSVSSFVAEVGTSPTAAYGVVKLDQVLRMRSGAYFKEHGWQAFQFSQEGMFRRVMRVGADQTFAQYLATLTSQPASLGMFDYKAADAIAAGLVADRIAGIRLDALLKRRLWEPLGMERRAKWDVERTPSETDRMPIASCCFKLGPRDLAKFGVFALQEGMWRGRRLLDAAWFRHATAFDGPIPESRGDFNRDCPNGYGLQWWTFERDGEYTAKGSGGSLVHVMRGPRHAVAVQLSDWRNSDKWDKAAECQSYVAHRSLADWAAKQR